MGFKAGLATAALALGATLPGAQSASADVVYEVDQTIGLGSVVGTLTTDGAAGTLALGDILSWNLTLNGVGASGGLNPINSITESFGPDLGLSVVGSDLYFNYSDPTGSNFLIQISPGESGATFWCNASYSGGCDEGKSVVPVFYTDLSSQFVSATGNQVIGVSGVPEVSTWAMMLAGFATLGVAGWRRVRKTASSRHGAWLV